MGITDIELDASQVVSTYKVGDSIDTTGLKVIATREDGIKTEIAVKKCTVECSGEVGDSVPVNVTFREITKSYNVKYNAIVLNGKVDNKDATIKMTSATECEYTLDGTKYTLNYSKSLFNGATYCKLSRLEGSNIDDAIWNAMAQNFVIDVEEGTLLVSKLSVYRVPDSGDGERPGTPRYENEPMPGIGGGTEQRTFTIDENTNTVTLTYKYWYANTTDTFVCKYTLEDGVLTLTEQISASGPNARWANLHKVWQLNDDGTATRLPQRSEA